jgi:hypothetical protein
MIIDAELAIRRIIKSRVYQLPPPQFIHVYASLLVESLCWGFSCLDSKLGYANYPRSGNGSPHPRSSSSQFSTLQLCHLARG